MRCLLANTAILLAFLCPTQLVAQDSLTHAGSKITHLSQPATNRVYLTQNDQSAQIDAITEAILDLTTTPRRNWAWYSCGKHLNNQKKITHAKQLATYIVTAAQNDLDPWWITSQLMQESSLNVCAVSSYEFREYKKTLKRTPTKRDLLKLLGNRATRERTGIYAIDAGIAQFRWPGRIAKMAGITNPKQLLDPELSINAFAKTLRYYKEKAPKLYQGTYITRRGKKIRYKKAGSEFYWTSYNTGDPKRFNYRYYSNVKSRYRIIERRREIFESS